MSYSQTCQTCHSGNTDAIHDMTGQYLLCRDCGHFEDLVPRTTHRASEYRPYFMRHPQTPRRSRTYARAA